MQREWFENFQLPMKCNVLNVNLVPHKIYHTSDLPKLMQHHHQPVQKQVIRLGRLVTRVGFSFQYQNKKINGNHHLIFLFIKIQGFRLM